MPGLRICFFFFQAEDGIRDVAVTGVQTCALPISVLDLGKRTAERPTICGGRAPRAHRFFDRLAKSPILSNDIGPGIGPRAASQSSALSAHDRSGLLKTSERQLRAPEWRPCHSYGCRDNSKRLPLD